MEKKYFIKTFGCQMNAYDSEQISALLEGEGYEFTGNAQKADVIILNTCSIREKAAQKVYSELGRFKEFKKQNPGMIIGIGGCLAQQWGKGFFKKAPHLDLVFGTQTLHRLPELINNVTQSCRQVVATELRGNAEPVRIPTRPRPKQISAYVTIMQGCNNFCSYCIVPYLRGPEVSRNLKDIREEVERLAGQGIKEVTLLGQNVNSYGKALSEQINFAGLLREIAQIEGIERIRFTTSHPKDLSTDLMDCFANIDKLCEHIHLPVQSGSDAVLERMNRGYKKSDYLEKIASLREHCPEISITSDVIVGFPGESDADFHNTIDLMQEIRFDNLFSFKYSEREGTAAARFAAKISDGSKSERLRILQSLQEEHTWEKNRQLVGRPVEILVEGRSKNSAGEMMGRTRTNKIVNFKGNSQLIGKVVTVFVAEAFLHSLHGELQAKKEIDRC